MAEAQLPEPGLYRHYKGRLYRVFAVARHSETGDPLVVYRALYGEGGVWVRPLAMFTEDVTVAGVSRPRFCRCADQAAATQELEERFRDDNTP